VVETRTYDTAEYLDSPEMIAEYLTEALETDDAEFIARAIGKVARARGMTAVAETAGVPRELLYKAIGGNAKSEIATLRRVLDALGAQSPSPAGVGVD
jgi:probable addiction module antidote protein